MTRSMWILILLLAVAGALQAQVAPERPSDVAAKAYRHPDLDIDAYNAEVGQLPPQAAAQARERLARLGVDVASARLDRRSGRFVTLMPTEPLVPGSGLGNNLSWSDLNLAGAPDRAGRERAVGDAFLGYLDANQADLGVDPGEISGLRVTSHGDGDLYQVYAQRTLDGIPVRGSYVSAVVGHGNLILMGAHQWGDPPGPSSQPQISAEEARSEAEGYLAPLGVSREWGKPELLYVPLARGDGHAPYRYGLVWSVKPVVEGDAGNWEALVDAHSGEILTFEDLNQYAEVKGGVYPVSNDGIPPDGVEQAGWPMPYASTTLGTTDTGGNVAGGGFFTASLTGPYVNINDNCGSTSLSGIDVIDFGTSGGTDCTTPAGGPAGNTHSSRTGFYELNKVIEMARGQLPANAWLQATLTSNMNISLTCNAYWNGTVNFFRSGSGCANTGEIAGVFDHEWGHGMDANDATPGIASPSGEGIADVYTALRLNSSCIGRGFRPGIQCGGYGDPCINCTGVRDIDYLQHVSGQPHTYTWSIANCGGGVHCSGYVYSEAVWSLWKRKLQSPPYNYDNNTAHEIVNRLTYLGAGATGTWYSGGPPFGGCAAGSGYFNYLAADDDNGNLTDGTPHMTAIYGAFNDQEIACSTPPVQDSGCIGVPTSAPSVAGTAGNNSASLSWSPVAGATSYEVFRTEGVFACDFGKVKIGSTTGTSWIDTGLQNGRAYSYVVIPKGVSSSCFGPASSCVTVTPISLVCTVDADCDDGIFCNGAETCRMGICMAGSDPCPGRGCDEVCGVCTAPGSQDAIYDAGLGAPKCAVAGTSCDSTTLLDSRDTLAVPEPNQPNTLDACTDGTSGTYHSDESIDRIVVSTLDGRGFCEGATVRIDATVWPWSSFSTDTADFYYAADANNPVWVYIGSVVPPAGGLQVLSQQYTLPAGSLQAVRVNFRYLGSVSTCGTGGYDDTDDLVFAVGECAVSCDACPGCVHQELEGFEAGNGGWAFNSGACTPAQGQFVSGTPNLVVDAGVTTQPAGAQAGSYALYTQPNSSPGVNDVDDTECIATSPVYNVAAKGSLSAWYFHGQRDDGDDPGDHFCLEVSVNNGPWTGMASFGDVTTQANWTEALEPVTGGDTVRLRIRAADGTAAIDLVEAGIDNISVCGETGLQGNE